MLILENHSNTPGKTYENVLMFESSGAVLSDMILPLNEGSSQTKGRIKFRGKFQEAEAINKNKRMYPYTILDENVKRLKESIETGGLCGELDHPTDSIIHFTNASHKITKLWWESKVLMGEGEILSTPAGKVLRALIDDGVRVGISSRGIGNGQVDENGTLVIGESYKLITFDAVSDPSTFSAFQEKITKANENIFNKNVNIETKNENRSINIDKDLLVAYINEVAKQITRKTNRG